MTTHRSCNLQKKDKETTVYLAKESEEHAASSLKSQATAKLQRASELLLKLCQTQSLREKTPWMLKTWLATAVRRPRHQLRCPLMKSSP